MVVSRGALAGALLLPALVVIQTAAHQPIGARSAALSTAAVTTPLLVSNAPEIPRWKIWRAKPAPPPMPAPAAPRSHVGGFAPGTARQPASPAAPPAAAVASSGAGQFALINRDRAAAGLPPLRWNDCLASIAVGQARRMAAQGYISHAGGRLLDLGCHLGMYASESIGVQWGHIDDAAMNAWFMGDPIHRANIMGPYHWVGAAWVWGANHEAYLAIEFG